MVALVVLVVLGAVGVLAFREWRSPSGRIYVQTTNGRTQLQMPTALVPVPTSLPGTGMPADTPVSAKAPSPPSQLVIPRIGVNVEVFPMADQPPTTAVVGWILGSAMPGTAGNTVIYGARAGAAAVFEHLDTLTAGDEVTVAAGSVAYVYRVTSLQEVPADQTDMLLPTSTPTLTLLTDAGIWDTTAARYTKRLVVRGTYVAAQPWSGK